MVVFDSDVTGMPVSEPEADSPLPIHADRQLTGPVALETLEAVPGRTAQVYLGLGSIQQQ